MIEFTFHIETGKNGLVFGLKNLKRTDPVHPDQQEAEARKNFEEHVLDRISTAAKDIVNELCIRFASENDMAAQSFEFNGPNKDELSKETRRRVMGEGEEDL
jgi:hypothetical protein